MTVALARDTTILVADDSAAQRRFLEILLQLDGYQVVSASSGPEALEQARAKRPGLAVLDVRMPGCDGLEVLRKLRRTPGLEQLPVVLISGASDAATHRQMKAAGAAAVLAKPLLGKDLRGLVRSLLADAEQHA